MTAQALARPTVVQLQDAWRNVGADSCPHVYNFHMHTHCSDGRLTPREVVEQACEIGLRGLAITDHHTIVGYRAALDLLPPDSSIQLWSGIEINSELLGCEVHVLGYGFDPDHQALKTYTQHVAPSGQAYRAKQVIAALHAAGGLAVLAHPFRYALDPDMLLAAAKAYGIDGVESYYNYRNPSPWKPSPKETEIALGLAHKYELFSTCGTDTHGPSLLRRL